MQYTKTRVLFLILVIHSFNVFIEQILVVQTLFGRQFTLVLRIVEKEKRGEERKKGREGMEKGRAGMGEGREGKGREGKTILSEAQLS